MPRIRLLPENNARQGFADAKEVATICRRICATCSAGGEMTA
jgi:hypothetical protein